MRTTMLRPLVAIFLAVFVCGEFSSGKERLIETWARSSPSETTWVPFAPAGDEFSAMIPAPPTFRVLPANYSIRKDGEKVLDHREYGGYGDGLVFVIESYKARRPQNLWQPLLENTDKSEVFERDLKLDDIIARQYRSAYAKFPLRRVRFVAKEHVYFLTLVTLEETNPAIERFLSSFRLRKPGEQAIESYAPESFESIPGEVFRATEVTRKATIAWKPEPTYTEQARAHQLVGTVKIEAVFASNGYVTNIKATKEMKDGMTENAIEAARNMRFFPAMKDGKPVSQRVAMEYNFSLY